LIGSVRKYARFNPNLQCMSILDDKNESTLQHFFKFPPEFARKFKSLSFQYDSQTNGYYLSKFCSHLFNLRRLNICISSELSIHDFVRCLANLPQLTVLQMTIENTYILFGDLDNPVAQN